MRKETIYITLCWALALFTMASCTSESIRPETEGSLRLTLAQVSSQTGTRSTPSELGAPVLDLFNVQISRQSDGAIAYNEGYTSDPITLRVGSYDILATCGEDVVIGYDAPYYKGTATATITTNQQTNVSLACSVANALVSVTFGRDAEEKARFDKYYADYGVMVSVGNYSLPIAAADAAKSVYFPAGSAVSLSFYGCLRGDNNRMVTTPLSSEALPATFAAADHAKLTLTLPDPASLLAVNIGKVEMETVTIDESIPLSWLPVSVATAQHQYNAAGELVGTDLLFTNSYPEMAWEAVVTNEAGSTVRTVSGTGMLQSAYSSSSDWPYLPAGKYKATYYLVNENGTRNKTSSREFMIGQPAVAVTLDGYSSYTRYQEGLPAVANELDGFTVYAPQMKVNIATSLLTHSNYTYQMTFTYDGESQQIGGNAYRMGNQTETPRQEPYVLSATGSFAGISLSATREFYVTGLPLRAIPPKEADGWSAGSDYVTFGNSEVKLGNRGGLLTHYNENINYNRIAIPAKTDLVIDYDTMIHPATSGTTLTCSINEGYLFSVTQGGGAANSKDYPHQGQVTYTTREFASTLRLNNSYGGGATCSYIYGLSITYGQ